MKKTTIVLVSLVIGLAAALAIEETRMAKLVPLAQMGEYVRQAADNAPTNCHSVLISVAKH